MADSFDNDLNAYNSAYDARAEREEELADYITDLYAKQRRLYQVEAVLPIGNIITAVAVLDIHIDKNAVTAMTAAICWLGLLPAISIVVKAIRLCNPHF